MLCSGIIYYKKDIVDRRVYFQQSGHCIILISAAGLGMARGGGRGGGDGRNTTLKWTNNIFLANDTVNDGKEQLTYISHFIEQMGIICVCKFT